jgi:hypothetical protein
MVARVGVVVGLVALVHGCSSNSDCDRSGCDAMTSPASGISVGIAGVVASESDLVENGCHECPFGQAQVEIWKVDTPITPEADVRSVVLGKPRIVTIVAAPFFRKTLDPGTYVVCMESACVEVSVEPGLVTTVNIMKGFGTQNFWIAEGSGQSTNTGGIPKPGSGF